MIDEYFNFQKFWDDVVYPELTVNEGPYSIQQYIEDYEVELNNISIGELESFLDNIPFPLCIGNCEIDIERKQLLFDFSEEYNESTESGYCSYYFIYSIGEESVVKIGTENG